MDLFDEQPAAQAGSPQGQDPMAFTAGGGETSPAKNDDTPMGVMDAFAGMEPTSMVDGSPKMVPDAAGTARIREWEKEQEEKANALAQKELHSKKTKRDEAQKALAQYYADRKEKITKRKALNRKDEKDWLSTQESSGNGKNPWERVLSMIPDAPIKPDVTPYQDTSRFKQVLLHLKTTSVPN